MEKFEFRGKTSLLIRLQTWKSTLWRQNEHLFGQASRGKI